MDPSPEPDRSVPADVQPWTEGFDSEDIGLVEERAWKSPGDLLKSYKALEHLKGAPPDKIVALPSEDATEAELNQFYSRLGRPEDPSGYGLDEIDVPEGSIDLRGEFGEWAYKAGLNPKQARAIAEANNDFMAETIQDMERDFQIAVNADVKDLEREYGAGFGEAQTRGKVAARELGVTHDMLTSLERAWGTKAMFQLFESIGSKIGELPGPKGESEIGGDPFVISPERARFEIDKIRNDPVAVKQYLDGNRDLINKMTRLQKLANPDQKE
jgi:hypothetical protein